MNLKNDLGFLYGTLEEIEKIDLILCRSDFGQISEDNEEILEGELSDYLKKMIVYLHALSRERSLLQVELDYSTTGVKEVEKAEMNWRLKEMLIRIDLLTKLFYAEVRSQFNAFTIDNIGIRDGFTIVKVRDYGLMRDREKKALEKDMDKKLDELSRDNRELNISEIIETAKLIPVSKRILPTKPVGPNEIIISPLHISDDLKHLFVLSRKYFKKIQLEIIEISYDKSDSNLTLLIEDIIMGLALLKIFFNNVHSVNGIDSNVCLGVRKDFTIVKLPDGESNDFELEIEGSIEIILSQSVKINRNFG